MRSRWIIRVFRETWRVFAAATLVALDGIIALSLLRQGRPKPGVRIEWPRGWREQLVGGQRGLCMYCRASVKVASHIDHMLPVNQGGSNDLENLQVLCPGCNLRKSDRSDAQFRYRYRQLLPLEPRRVPDRKIRQQEFRNVAQSSPDATSYTRFRAGKYLTPAQKINTGSLATGAIVVVVLVTLLPWVPAILSVLLGIAAGTGVRARAWRTGRDQED